MLTRAKTSYFRPKVFLAQTESEPTSYKQALLSPPWAKAMQVEFNALQANKTWTLNFLPFDRVDVVVGEFSNLNKMLINIFTNIRRG